MMWATGRLGLRADQSFQKRLASVGRLACHLLGMRRPHRHRLGLDLFLHFFDDEVFIQRGGDRGVTRTLDHGRQLARLELVQGPFQGPF